jgi:hypothetical protein
MSTLLKDYEEDVADSKKAVEQAEQEVADAIKWHHKMLVNYANDIQRLDIYKKENGL